ncbi:ubiquinol-cytochrome c reductase iron-sulfur subunit [Ectobacillus ponti]|uniref:Rieske 2Fe-2S domain-containing protein n=1 Tax=Ectobacillus ponti TaxID=2961894 RepID=A0AA41X948_9BACI|nr:Rieske 2Fe-2S domain-containing protein [Ectobacillus ponti]MCP8969423.1 Rieske 2Fe-2S domain-containing protein [Ectobacillus ponti]
MKRLDEFLQKAAFNVRRDKEIDLNRRGFIVSSLSLMGVMFASSFPLVARTLHQNLEDPPKGIKIAGADELKVGDSKPFHYPDEHEPSLLIRISEEEYRAYNIKCTHLQCPVYYDKPSNQMACPCHNGYFSVEDGNVLAGPPQRPLTAVLLEKRNDGIYAMGLDGRSM